MLLIQSGSSERSSHTHIIMALCWKDNKIPTVVFSRPLCDGDALEWDGGHFSGPDHRYSGRLQILVGYLSTVLGTPPTYGNSVFRVTYHMRGLFCEHIPLIASDISKVFDFLFERVGKS